MAVKRRTKLPNSGRVDQTHFRILESSVTADFDDLIKGFVTGTTKPYILRGFEAQVPTGPIAATEIVIEVADSAILHTTATEPGSIFTVAAGTAAETLSTTNSRVIGSFQNGTTNYIALDLRRAMDDSTVDQVGVWSESQQVEFQRTVPIGNLLDYKFIITTNGFGSNLPLYTVKTSSTGVVEYIVPAKDSLYRLGTGGAIPNPYASFDFQGLINSQTGTRREWISTNPVATNPLAIYPGDPADAMRYGDFSILSDKDWKDAVMTRFKEITGSDLWYVDSNLSGATPSIGNLFLDSGAGQVMTGNGYITYNLILETEVPQPLSGAFQTVQNDPTILVGDSYVIGATSKNKANLTIHDNGRLVINSQTKSAFIYSPTPEQVLNRRRWRPNLALWSVEDVNVSPDKLGLLKRIATTTPNQAVSAVANTGSLVDLTVPLTFGAQVGDLINVTGLAGTDVPVGVYRVRRAVTSGSDQILTIRSSFTPTGLALGSALVCIETDTTVHPYLTSFKVASAVRLSSTSLRVYAPEHNVQTGQTVVLYGIEGDVPADYESLNDTFTVAAANLGSYFDITTPAYTSTTFTVDAAYAQYDLRTMDLAVSGADQEDYNVLTVTATVNNDTEILYKIGPDTLPNLPNASGLIEFDGVVASTTILDPVDVSQVRYSSATKIFVKTYRDHGYTSTITSSTVSLFGDPAVNPYTGTYSPATISDITLAGTLSIIAISQSGSSVTVTTSAPHGLAIGNTVNVSGTTNFNATERRVTAVNSTVQFVLNYPSASPAAEASGTVTTAYEFSVTLTQAPHQFQSTLDFNFASGQVFLQFANNPYAGPIQWSSDIVFKDIIGERAFVIPQTATVDTLQSSPLANQFNTGNITGTAFLEDGEALYVILDRDQLVTAGDTFSTLGGAAAVTGSLTPLHADGTPLKVGDYVRFLGESNEYWYRISPASTNTDGELTTNSFILVDDKGNAPTVTERPAATGKLQYTRGSYSQVLVNRHRDIPADPNVFWLAVRRDNGSLKAKAYFRALELELGETRQINDNAPSNLLIYTGAGNEAAVNPNYTVIDQTGPYQESVAVSILRADTATRMITIDSAPQLGVQKGDVLSQFVGPTEYKYKVKEPLSGTSFISEGDVSTATVSAATYLRLNHKIEDSDNLTLAARKMNREQASTATALERTVYDESTYLQVMQISASVPVESGSYVWIGTETNPTALAWVMHGTQTASMAVDSGSLTLPGGNLGGNKFIISVISDAGGLFVNGAVISHRRPSTDTVVTRTLSANLTSPAIQGDQSLGSNSGTELVMPPNKRTAVIGTGYVVFPQHSYYKAALGQGNILAGEELLVFTNDQVREANVDYEETFSGPRAKVRLLRDVPPNTRMRFRVLGSYGSALIRQSSSVTLQDAYNGGRFIVASAGLPVDVTASDKSTGGTAIKSNGSVTVDGTGLSGVPGGFMPATDKGARLGSDTKRVIESWTAQENLKTHDTHAGSEVKRFTAGLSTTTSIQVANQTVLTLSPDEAVRVLVKATARSSGGAIGASTFSIEGTFYRDGASATAAAGVAIGMSMGFYGDGSSWALTLTTSGNDVVAAVIGSPLANVEWALVLETQKVGVA
jgi:hypothetical protein